jgi:hypothetical protein
MALRNSIGVITESGEKRTSLRLNLRGRIGFAADAPLIFFAA